MDTADAGARRRLLPLMLFAAYPALAHTSIVLEQPWLRWLALLVLYTGAFLAPLLARRMAAWAGLLAFAAATGWLMRANDGMYALYAVPLVLLGLAFSVFARSLLPGNEALVTRIAESVDGPLPATLRVYTRRVTLLWAAVLATMLLVALTLSITGPRAWWSLFSNLLCYLFMGILFAGEYAYRRWRFPDRGRQGFVAYLGLLIREAPRMRGRG